MAIRTKTGRIINIKPKSKTTTSPLAVDDSYMNSTQGVGSTGGQNTNTTVDMESQGDEILSPVKGDVNYGQSFNYSTGTFANGNKPKGITPTVSKVSAPSTIAGPSTASNLTKPQSTVMVGGVKKSKYLPETLELRQGDEIGIDKKEEIIPSFDFNTNLSNLYGKGLTDKSAIFGELSKDKSFAALDSVKQQEYITQMTNNIKDMNEAKAKADMTNEQFDPAEYARLKGFDIQTGDVKEIQKGRKEITDTLKYQGTIYDNNAEDMKFKKEQTIKQLDQNIEQTKIQVNRQIDDVMRQSQQTIAMGEKVGALKGYNKSGGYVQGLLETQNQAMQNIQRLQQDLARAEMLTGEDKALAMQEYEKNMTRSKEKFDYDMRKVIADGSTELGKLVMGKYDPKKLGEMLDNLSYDVIQKRMDIEAQYINNMKSANDVVSQQFDQYRAMDDYTDKQRQEFTSILNANDGEALASMSAKDIENFVSQGYLSQEQGAAYYQSMVSKTIGALSEYGIPTQDDIDTVIDSIKNGSTPLQSVAGVVQNNSDRYSSVKDKFMTVGANSSIFNTQTGQFMTAPGGAGGTTTQQNYNGPTIPPASPEKLNNAYTKYTSMKNGSVVRGGECGMFVNDYIKTATGINYNMFVDPIDVRKTQTNSQTPSVGSVIVLTSSGTANATKYGHVGIVTGINQDGSISIKDQNGKIKGAVGTQTIAGNDPKIVGYFDPTKGISAGTQNNDSMKVLSLVQGLGGTAEERQMYANNILTLSQQKGISLEDAKKELKYKSDDDIKFAQTRKEQLESITKSSDAVSKGKQALTILNNKQTAIGDVAAIVGFLKTIDPSSVARESEVASVENARGVIDTLSNKFAKMSDGKKLTTEQRTQLKDSIMQIVNSYEKNISSFVNETKQEFDDRGLDASIYIPRGTLNKYVALDTSKTENILNLARNNTTKPLQTPQQPVQTKQPLTNDKEARLRALMGL